MPEILTESFCERCGTRYTFETAAPTRAKKLGRFKTISKGLKNYVLSDDSSMDEAMAAARSDEEREVTSHQLDAFHATFNFCMTCRQYTCGNCWNQAEGRCLTCAPHLGHEIMPAPFPDLTPMHGQPVHVEATAWPMTDVAHDAPDALTPPPDLDQILAARLARISGQEIPKAVAPPAVPPLQAEEEPAGAWPMATEPGLEVAETLESVDATAEAELAEVEEWPIEVSAETVAEAPPVVPVVEAEAPPVEAVQAVEAVEAQPAAEELPAGVDERAAAASRRTSALLSKFRPGQNIDAELAAYEASITAEPAVEAPMPEQVAEPIEAAAEPDWVEPEVVAAAPEPEPEPVAAIAFAAPVEEPVAAEAAAPIEEAPAEIAAELPEEVAAAAPVEVAAEAPVEPTREYTAPAPEPVRADRVEQPTWRTVAPDVPAVPTNGHGPADEGLPAVASTSPIPPTPSEPEWPVNPQWPVAPPNASLLANRRTSTTAANEALWAASARDVVAQTTSGGVQSCSSCGLSLSATARFCRRCGSRQGA